MSKHYYQLQLNVDTLEEIRSTNTAKFTFVNVLTHVAFVVAILFLLLSFETLLRIIIMFTILMMIGSLYFQYKNDYIKQQHKINSKILDAAFALQPYESQRELHELYSENNSFHEAK